MASILEALFPGWPQIGPQPQPLPVPNPLRLQTPPQPSMPGILDRLLSFPNPFTGMPELEKRVQADKDKKAISRYQEGANPETRAPAGSQDQRVQQLQQKIEDELPDDEETPPVPQRNPFDGGGDGGPAGGRAGSAGGKAGDPSAVASAMPQTADPFKAALLQLGLNLMVPQWGGPLANLGMALGGAAQAAGTAQKLNEADAEKARQQAESAAAKGEKSQLTQAQIKKIEAETEQTLEETASGESSRSRRISSRKKTPLDETAEAAGLGPKGKLYLQTRIKELNKFDPLIDEGDPDPAVRLQEMINEAKKLDTPTAPAGAGAPAKAPNTGTDTIQALPLVNSPEEAKKLAPGTKFYFQDPVTKQLQLGTVPKS